MNKTRIFRTLPCLLLVLTLCASLLAGCSAGVAMDTASSMAAGAAAPQAVPKEEYGYNGMMEMTADSYADGSASTQLKSETETPLDDTALLARKIIRMVDLSMETLEFDTLIPAISAEAEAIGGYLERSSVEGSGIHAQNNRRHAYITARIPQEKLNSFLGTVGEIGHITYRSESSNDVTLQYVDIDSRKRTLEVEQERLLALLETATDLDSIIRLEERLSEVRYQLEGYTSKLRTIDSEVNYSTVNIEVQEVRRITDPTPVGLGERISTGFARTLRSIADDAQDFAVWFVINIPYFLIWAALLALAFLLLRLLLHKLRRSARRKAAPPRHPRRI